MVSGLGRPDADGDPDDAVGLGVDAELHAAVIKVADEDRRAGGRLGGGSRELLPGGLGLVVLNEAEILL